MRLYNFLQETPDNTEKDIIIEDCLPFLRDWKSINNFKDAIIWRGMKNLPMQHSNKLRTNKNRKPLDTNKDVHKFVDSFYKKKFGIGLRSETIFASILPVVTQSYGTTYALIPCGKYRIFAHSKIKDLYIEVFDNNISFITKYFIKDNWNKLVTLFKQNKIIIEDSADLTSYQFAEIAGMFINPLYSVTTASKIKSELNKAQGSFGYILEEKDSKLHITLTGKSSKIDFTLVTKYFAPIWEIVRKKVEEVLDETSEISLSQAAQVKNELMVYCDEYWVVDRYFLKSLLPYLKKSV